MKSKTLPNCDTLQLEASA